MNKLEDYTDYEFESSTTRTEEYISFERKYTHKTEEKQEAGDKTQNILR